MDQLNISPSPPTAARINASQFRTKGPRLTAILSSLVLSVFMSAMELTAVTTALPTIIQTMGGTNFVWVGAAYALASTAFLPSSGAIAEIFGRRPAMLTALLLFSFGSVLCGSAQNLTWLIAGRAVQGMGGAAIQSISSIIVSDLASLQERGKYYSFISLGWALAAGLGPLVGGYFATRDWRWVFYINLPAGGMACVVIFLFLDLPIPPGTVSSKLRKLDWIGNFLVISSTTVLVIGLTWGGISHPWSSYEVVLALVIGFSGFIIFFVYEATCASHPIVPLCILSNRTSLSGYVQNFVNFVSIVAAIYYLPVYFQACKDDSAFQSGIDILTAAVVLGVFIAIAGLSVAVTKCYRPQIYFSWIGFLVGTGLLTTLNADTPHWMVVSISVVPAVALGSLAALCYFPILAPISVEQNAYAISFYAFIKNFAGIWGVAIGSTVLQNELQRKMTRELRGTLRLDEVHGIEQMYAFIPHIRSLEEPLKGEIQRAIAGSLTVLWYVILGFGGVGFIASLAMRDIPLQDIRDEKWATPPRQEGSGDLGS